jgi:glycosyltransferase involved in cell wall biosynthesis
MPALWSVCDVGLVHLKDQDVLRTVIPSKIFECFGMGVPVLYAGPDSEGAQIVRDARGGVTLPAEQPDELAKTVLELSLAPERVRELARNARAAAPAYDRERNALAMLEVLRKLSGESLEASLSAQGQADRAAA